jgi:hypothetical protein
MTDMFALELEPTTVILRPGLEVPLEVLQFGWALESRGVSMRVDGSDIVVEPRRLLSEDDLARLRRHAPLLLRLLLHVPEVSL